jgi:rare lipoprotein A
MKKRMKLLITTVLGLQLYCTPLIIAEPATNIGSGLVNPNQAEMVLDSLHTGEPPSAPPGSTKMVATYYSRHFHGHKTASGERYDKDEFTCAHKTFPFDTLLKISNPQNDSTVVVRVNDRGPFSRKRHLDLSYAAAKQLGMLRSGVIPVEVVVIPTDSDVDKLVKR